MLARLRSRLTYANVMATAAVFIALGGSATAAVLITGKNVKNGSLTGLDVKNNSLGSVDVKDGGLLAKDFKRGQLPAGAQGPKGDQGVQGVQGDTGAKGDQGPAGPTFGATKLAASGSESGCADTTLQEMTVTVTKPSRIFATGYAAYDREATNLKSGELWIALLDSSGTTTVGLTSTAIGSDFDTANTERIPISVMSVLSVPGSFGASDTGLVADPGTYKLRLIGRALDGSCTGSSQFWYASLSYILLGTGG